MRRDFFCPPGNRSGAGAESWPGLSEEAGTDAGRNARRDAGAAQHCSGSGSGGYP